MRSAKHKLNAAHSYSVALVIAS